MEALRAAVVASPAALSLLEEAARLQACGRCCLRLAAVREPAAYASGSALPASAHAVLRQLRSGETSVATASQTPSADQAEVAEEAEAVADCEGAQGSSKRRKLDIAATLEPAAVESPAIEPAAAAVESPVAEPVAAAVCPLCFGLLQLADNIASAQGLPSCALVHLVTTTSTLNEPQRHAAEIFGTESAGMLGTALGASTATDAAGAAPPPAGANGQAGAGLGAAPVVMQHIAPMPSLAAAAAAIAAEYDFDCFALEVSLPASLAVRQQALSWRLRQAGEGQERGQALAAVVDVKEAVKLCCTSALEATLGKPHDSSAALRLALTASHPDAAAECGWLAPSSGGGGRQRRGGRHGRQQQRGQAAAAAATGAGTQPAGVPALSEAVVQRLAAMPAAQFAASCPPAATQLLSPAVPATVQLQARRAPVHVGGRYLKLRRGIPQSPWFIDGQRKGEGSVQEAIERAVLPAFQADAFTFISAGREDIDVRMLGEGRPFILEIHNARRSMPPPERLRALEAAALEASHGGVAVRGLFAASPCQLALLKEGEQEKEKSYVAVCWLPRQLTDDDVALIEGTTRLEVHQQTPVRVLHRRANLDRPKLVHHMRVQRLPPSAFPSSSGGAYFVLHLRTEAGTYIKEFVHGDLGRTRPSLGDLLGGCRAQIVSLDVAQVHLERFGPESGLEWQEQEEEQRQEVKRRQEERRQDEQRQEVEHDQQGEPQQEGQPGQGQPLQC